MAWCGITRLANVTGLDALGIPVVVSVRPNARSVSVSQGKGIDLDAARASALLESIELWHAENLRLPVERLTVGQRRARGDGLPDLRLFPRADAAASDGERDDLPADLSLAWVEGWDVGKARSVRVPLDLVSMDLVSRPGSHPEHPTFHQNSNGLASGNHVLEAMGHGLCELIERDAVTLHVHDESDPTGRSWLIDLDALEPGTPSRGLVERLRAAGVHVAAQDLTSDIGIPTYAAVIFDRPNTPRAMGWFWGFGTHLDPEVALSRAITEAAQCRLTELSGARDDLPPEDFVTGRDDDELARMEEVLLETKPVRRLSDRRSLATESFEADVEVLLEALRRVGLEDVVAVDLAHPELGVAVVKVLVPGLEPHFTTPFYRPGPRATARSAR